MTSKTDDDITPPHGYANTREGASAPDSSSALRWDCGHLTTEHTRAEAAFCRERVARVKRPRVLTATASDICTQASAIVSGDRQTTHGDKSLNFTNIAALWNAIIDAKSRRSDWPSISTYISRLDALDVANMLEALKIARRYSGSHDIDDYIDGAGYAACAGEIADADKLS